MCVTPEERRPHAMAREDVSNQRSAGVERNSGECPICLESFSEGTLCVLPCKHEFHGSCVEELRNHGVQQVCPLCRTSLPPGPEKLFGDAICMWLRMKMRHEVVDESWNPLTAAEKNNMAQVVDMWTNAANQGHAGAQYVIGFIYHFGSGVAQDFKKSVQWTQKAADQGLADAQFSLGSIYSNGEGVSQDYDNAVEWYRKAADQGYAIAQFNLGNTYINANGVAQDYKEAVEWYRKAADQGYVEAQFNLGSIYSNGEGVAKDSKEAVNWYHKAADQGYVEAQFNLGKIYRDGKGVAQDLEKAAEWYRKAADQGFACAQFNLGTSYRDGKGVAQDSKEAVEWFRKAADQGFVEAQITLGAIYLIGAYGIPKDLKAANIFITAAEAQGDQKSHVLRKELEEACLHQTFICPSSQCACCGRSAGNTLKLKPCPRCKGPSYCGKECQRKHWNEGHKEDCVHCIDN